MTPYDHYKAVQSALDNATRAASQEGEGMYIFPHGANTFTVEIKGSGSMRITYAQALWLCQALNYILVDHQ